LKRNPMHGHSAPQFRRHQGRAGFTLIEMLIVVAVGIVLTVIAIPVVSRALVNMQINSAVSDFEGAIASSRYRAIKDSQAYTFVITVPANTYVLSATGNTISLPPYIAINGGTAGTYTYDLCPNGMVYGAGGCPGAAPPALSFAYQGRQINIAVSEVGNVTTTIIH
jgi:prepilin-type N-terminal cleavage/methylation domain-containing protein